MHPISYAEGLIEELGNALRSGDTERADITRADLTAHAENLRDAPEDLRTRIAEALGVKPKTAKAAPQTAKAPVAPETATPPAAK
jgi:hypothetical protein